MALWDKDKSSDKRLSPSPSARDIDATRRAHGTIGFTLKQEDTDPTLAKLVLKDGRLQLEVQENVFLDLSNGNMELKRANTEILSRMGYRPDDSEGAIEIAKTTTSL